MRAPACSLGMPCQLHARLGSLACRQQPAPALTDDFGCPAHAARRHSNDQEDIRQISILPTSDEVLCSVAPYLPKGASLHLPPGSAEAHIDRQFRCGRS